MSDELNENFCQLCDRFRYFGTVANESTTVVHKIKKGLELMLIG